MTKVRRRGLARGKIRSETSWAQSTGASSNQISIRPRMKSAGLQNILRAQLIMDVAVSIPGDDLFICISGYIASKVLIRKEYDLFLSERANNHPCIGGGAANVALCFRLSS